MSTRVDAIDRAAEVLRRIVSECEDTFYEISDMTPAWQESYADAKEVLLDLEAEA